MNVEQPNGRNPHMGRRIIAILSGFVAGFIVVSLFMVVSMLMHPPPAGIDYNDREAMNQYLATLPPSAFIVVILGHSAGALAAAFTYLAVLRRVSWVGVLAFGVAFLIAGIINVTQAPHPVWFIIIDSLLYVPAAALGGWLACRIFQLPK